MTEADAILDHLPAAMLVMFRIGGMMIFGPLFGSPIVPVRVKVLLSLVLGLAIYPVLNDAGATLSTGVELNLWALAPVIFGEISIGMVIGFVAALPLLGMQIGGLVMGQQMGLGFARFFDPSLDSETDILGQVFFLAALAGFLIVGGHEAMLLAVMHSFHHLPAGAAVIDVNLIGILSGLLTASMELALRVSAPLLAVIFLETVAVGFIAKTVPQLNILSLGFPLRILVGFGIVALGFQVIDDVFMDSIDQTLEVMFQWIETGRESGVAGG